MRTCLIDPIDELFDAARCLDEAVSAHLAGDARLAGELIRRADRTEISRWSESLWGAGGPWTRPRKVESPLPFVEKTARSAIRMPTLSEKRALVERDGRHCRFCQIPLIRTEVIARIRRLYPIEARWGARNAEQHFGLQALMLHYDHIIPHARGGTNETSNMIVACAPCNCGRSNLTLEEVGLSDPRLRPPTMSDWGGLERLPG